jgi:predicted nucleic acid-binding protein
MPDSAYWDTCLFIEILQKDNQERFEACEEMRAKAEKGELVIVTSTLTIVEVNKLPESGALPEEQSRQILDFLENPYIVLRQLDRPTAERAHEIVRVNGLSNADAIHVATALLAKVPVLYTYDVAKKKRRGLIRHHLKIGNPPLRIEIPPKPSEGPLFDLPAQIDPPGRPERRIIDVPEA